MIYPILNLLSVISAIFGSIIAYHTNMKKIIYIFLALLIPLFAFRADTASEIDGAIKSGNSKSVAAYFADNVDLKILNDEDVYSKAQAEMILKDFFAKHAVKSFSVLHNSVKNDSKYCIGALETANGKYRLYYLLKKTGDKMLIHQFRIETENE